VSVGVVRVQTQGRVGSVADRLPVQRAHGRLRLVEEAINLALHTFAWHGSPIRQACSQMIRELT
jgi:hypothetical protein